MNIFTQPAGTRRGFVTLAGGLVASTFLPRWLASESPRHRHRTASGPHPDPRPGIDGSNVLSASEVPGHVAKLFDGIREIPHIADGIRCECGCADTEGMRSLLSCFEADGMAAWCKICQSEGGMVVRLHEAGRTLDQIRAAVDARFG